MAREPSPGQYQRLNDWQNSEDPTQRGPANENSGPHLAALKSAVPDLSQEPAKAEPQQQQQQQQEGSKSPGWTDRGGMEAQQNSALNYNKFVNQPYAEHNASLAERQKLSEPMQQTQGPNAMDPEKAEQLQRARELMNSANARLDQDRGPEQEKTIGD